MSRRHYIVVVHGMGEQTLNATVPPVVQRFAEVRLGKDVDELTTLLPANISGQAIRQKGAGHGWSEFDGIPTDSQVGTGLFDAKPVSNFPGRNFRFVDLSWAHILQDGQEKYGSPVEAWSHTLLERVNGEALPQGWMPTWGKKMLHSIVYTVLPLKTVLGVFNPALASAIFKDVLGDVHLYGDCTRIRGRAVRHFHVILDEIFIRDYLDWLKYGEERGEHQYRKPEFSVIAHSLGSVMSFDALTYAFANEKIREGRKTSANHYCASLPFSGYAERSEGEKETWEYLIRNLDEVVKKNPEKIRNDQEDKWVLPFLLPFINNSKITLPKIPPLHWRHQVKHFITLGSPLDKFHVLWYQNYLHMGLSRQNIKTPLDWDHDVDKWLEAPTQRIRHYNLCDEQDPVGHHLDITAATLNYSEIFDTSIPVRERDVVFRRYAKPGLAHIKYWEDQQLFEGILNHIIDPNGSTNPFIQPSFREGKKSLKQAILWAYLRIPFAVSLATGLLILYAMFGGILLYQVAAGLGAFLLWINPNFWKGYEDEADPKMFSKENTSTFKTSWLAKFRLQPGIFPRLIIGMIEWRIILRELGKTQNGCGRLSAPSSVPYFTGVGFLFALGIWLRMTWPFIASLIFFLVGLDPFQWELTKKILSLFVTDPITIKNLNNFIQASLRILPLCYWATMIYVAIQILKAKFIE